MANIGCVDGYTDLKIGHYSGIDIINDQKKLIFEIKNRFNTDNSSSKKANFDKLAKCKQFYPEYTPIYGIIQPKDGIPVNNEIYHNGIIIKLLSGKPLFDLIFEDNADLIIPICQVLSRHLNVLEEFTLLLIDIL